MKSNLDTIFNVVVGTAGHIDHGKSSLVQRLTGIDPDRLPEEKSRGLTIDLGFAPLTLDNGQRVGIIDVPGHERLVKNMVAGATGIDLVVLVVAADDGVMPQTREHVDIMDLLGLQRGIIAVTKIDMVDSDMRELVREDIRESLSGSFLADAPLLEVSSTTGEGIDALRARLHEEITTVERREPEGVFRMPIQRVFSSKGFGTVVTGVPISGQTKIGATLEVVPLGEKGRIRGIHAYKEATDLARAGHSAAINLTDVDYRTVLRGMVLGEPGYFQGSSMFETQFTYLPSNKKPLVHQSPVRLHVGTAEAIGRAYLLERKVVEPGETTFVQFRLETPIAAAPGDRFVIRSYSPSYTIGGGEVLNRSQWRLKTGRSFVIDGLKKRAGAIHDADELVMSTLEGIGNSALTEKDLTVRAGLASDDAGERIQKLVDDGKLLRAKRAGYLVSTDQLAVGEKALLAFAEKFFRDHPRRVVLEKPQVKDALSADDVFLTELLGRMSEADTLSESSGGKLRLRGFAPQLSDDETAIKATIDSAFAEQLFTPPSPAELAETHGWDAELTADLARLLEEEGELTRIGDGIVLHRTAIEEAKTRLKAYLEENETMTAADAKNVLGSTRKYSIPLLEHLDQIGFTVRQGDKRALRKSG